MENILVLAGAVTAIAGTVKAIAEAVKAIAETASATNTNQEPKRGKHHATDNASGSK